jgi:anti-sigma B factor antagonist
MEIKKRSEGKCIVVDIEGELDYITAISLRKVVMELMDGKNRNIIINMEKVHYMDSTGLGTLITLWQKSKAQSIGLKYAHPADTIMRLLVLSRLNAILPLTSTVEDAQKELEGS